MKKLLRLLIIFVLLFSTAQASLYAQKKSRVMRKADTAFNLEEYSRASELYKKAYKKSKNKAIKAEIIFKQAECYRMSSKIKQAASYYKRALRAKYPDVIVHLRYAEVLRMKGELNQANIQYTKYLEKCGVNKEEIDKLANDDIRKVNYIKGEMGLRSCQFASKWKDAPTRYIVKLMPVVNGKTSDFSPAFGNGEYSELYFTSSREGGLTDKKDARTGEPFTDVWMTKIDKKGAWSRPTVMTEPINTEGNEGSVYVNKRGTAMYLTQCKVEKKKDLGCGIYISERKGKIWGTPQQLQIKVDENTTIGHPALSQDESVLVFSSNLAGGYGGKDLWISMKGKRNTWSEPMNLGPLVNTPGDEMFPFLAEDGVIYFASNGHLGMGGFDIYKTSKDENGAYLLPVNLKMPVNSFADDFGMIVEESGERGYLTSNRLGGKGGDDIYQFELPALNVSVQGIVTDSRNQAIVTAAQVQLVGSDGTTNEIKTDNTGKYSFKLNPLTSYEIIVNKEGYLTQTARETTEGIELDKIFIVDVSIDRVKKKVVLPLIKFDFNKFDLRSEAIVDLDILVEGLLDNPNVIIQVSGHTDDIGSDMKNKKLSQQRADICVAYLASKGVDPGQLIAKGMGEGEPFVIEEKDGRLKVGDVLTESYIRKIKFKRNKEKANQYNRRTSFKVIGEDYAPAVPVNR
mgnify:CR=1 FL=1